MDTLTALRARRSVPRLVEPAPTEEELATMLAAAGTAPDHGRHRPWRFTVISGTGRAAFGDVLARAYRERASEPVDAGRVDRERAKPLRAPTIVVVACAAGADERVPRAERLAATAAATENLLLAATALGYGTMWRTGWPATDPRVKAALGLTDGDDIVGFVYLGTVRTGEPPAPRPRGDAGQVRTWPESP